MNNLPGFNAEWAIKDKGSFTNALNAKLNNAMSHENTNGRIQRRNYSKFSKTVLIPTGPFEPMPMPDYSAQAQYECLNCKGNCQSQRTNTCDDFYQARLEMCERPQEGRPGHDRAVCLHLAHNTYRQCAEDLADYCSTTCGSC